MEENTRKFTFKKLVKIIIFSISALVYLIFFARFVESCDASIANDVYLREADYEKFVNLDEDFPFYHYQPQAWTAEDGSVTVTNVYYIEKIENLQLTVRHRNDIYSGETPFEFEIRVVDENGDVIKSVTPEQKVDSRSKYTWTRLYTDGIVSVEAEEREVEYETFDENGRSVITTSIEFIGGTKTYLDIYDLDGNLLYSFQLMGVARLEEDDEITTRKIDSVRIRRGKADAIKIY